MTQLQHYLDISNFRLPKWLDEETVIYISNKNGVNQLWKKGWNEEAQVLTHNENFIFDYIVDYDNDLVYFTFSEGGDEKFQIYRLKDDEVTKISKSNDVVNYLGSLRNKGKEIIYTSNQRDFAHFDLVAYDVEKDQEIILVENNDNYNFPMVLSPDGQSMLYQKLFSETDQPLWIYHFENGSSEPLFDEKASYDKPVWKTDSSGFYYLTNAGSDFIYLAEYDLESKAFKRVEQFDWDIENIALTSDGSHLALVINEDGRSLLKVYQTDGWEEVMIEHQPSGEIAFYDKIQWDQSNRLLFTFSSGSRPNEIIYYDLAERQFKTVIGNELHASIKELTVEPELKHFTSFDGLKVPYWLYVPNTIKEIPKGGMPLIIEIHGGPEGQERTNFNEYIQYILSEGIAVAAPNVRGSTGYGKNYSNLDNVEKRLDSVKDIEWLVKDLLDEKIAHPDKIVVSGTSYGGFMSLSCAARLPNLFCGAVDNVGMFNLVTFLENTSSYRRAHRESEYGSLENNREMLFEVSPVAAVDNIKGPLMVIHGANDARVPVSEAEQLVDYLREREVEVNYLRYEDEGHGLQKRKNKLDCYPQVISFVKKCMKL